MMTSPIKRWPWFFAATWWGLALGAFTWFMAWSHDAPASPWLLIAGLPLAWLMLALFHLDAWKRRRREPLKDRAQVIPIKRAKAKRRQRC